MTHLLKEQFALHDKFSCGVIPKSQFTATLSNFGLKSKGIQRISQKFQNGTSDVDYRAFLNYFTRHQKKGSGKKHFQKRGTTLRRAPTTRNTPQSSQDIAERETIRRRIAQHEQQQQQVDKRPKSPPSSVEPAKATVHEKNSPTTQKRAYSRPSSSPEHQKQHHTKSQRVQRDVVGNYQLTNVSKLYQLRDKLHAQLVRVDSAKTGFVTPKRFQKALQDSGLKQTSSLKALTKAFSEQTTKSNAKTPQVDYHHFLSLITPSTQLDEHQIGTGINHEPLVTRNKGEGAGGKRKRFQHHRPDSMASVLKDRDSHDTKPTPTSSKKPEWLPQVAHQATGIYSQIFDKFFSHDPVFTGYVDKKSFENVVKQLNIAPKESIPSIVQDIGDSTSGKVDYNKFMQAIIEERRTHQESGLGGKIIKNYDPKGQRGVRAVDGGSRYQDQVFKSNVLHHEPPLTDAEKDSISGVRKKNLHEEDQIRQHLQSDHPNGSQSNNEDSSSASLKKPPLNRTNSARLPSEQDIIMQKIRSKVYQKDVSLSNIFLSYDTDRNGVVDYAEFKEALKNHCELPLSDSQLKPIFSRFDTDNKGEIEYNQFAQQLVAHSSRNLSSDVLGLGDARDPVRKRGLKSSKYAFATSSDNTVTDTPASTKFDREMDKLRRHISEKANVKSNSIHDLFRSLDNNHDGVLSYRELRNGLESIGVPLSDAQFNQIAQVSDRANKGHVNFDQFASLVSGKPNDEFLFHSLLDKSFYDRKRGLKYIEEPLSKDQKLVANRKRKFGAASHKDGSQRNGMHAAISREDRPLFDKLQSKLYGKEENLKDLFRRMDNGHEGRITREQFQRSLQNIGASLSRDEYEKLFSHIDTDRSNSIDYSEFASFMLEDTTGVDPSVGGKVAQGVSRVSNSSLQTLSGSSLRQALKSPQMQSIVDHLDENGSMPATQFQSYLEKQLPSNKRAEIQSLIRRIDPSQSGKIRYSNFMNYVSEEELPPPRAVESNMDPSAVGMSNVEETMVASTEDNPHDRGYRRPNELMDQNTRTIQVLGTPKRHKMDDSKFVVSDNQSHDVPDSSVIEQSQSLSPPKTPIPECKILRHTEVPTKSQDASKGENSRAVREDHPSTSTKQNASPSPRIVELKTVMGRPVSFNQFNRLCRAFDEQGNGKITQQAFHTALDRLGVNPQSADLQNITRACTKGKHVDYKKMQFVLAGLAPAPPQSSHSAETLQAKKLSKSPLAPKERQKISEKINQKNVSLTNAFLSADSNRSGFLNQKELHSALKNLEINLAPEKIESISKSYGDAQGRINLQQFINFAQPQTFWEQHAPQHDGSLQPRDNLPIHSSPDASLQKVAHKLQEKTRSNTDAFLTLDSKKEGRISLSDLGASLQKIGIRLDEKEVQRLAKKFDQNRDGHISFSEFARAVESQEEHDRASTAANRSSAPKQDFVTRTIRRELLEGTQNKALKLHEAFKALDYTKERHLDENRFRQALQAAAGPSIPSWMIDRSVHLAQSSNVAGAYDYEKFLNQIGIEVPQFNQHKFKVPSPKIPTRHQHHHSTSGLLSDTNDALEEEGIHASELAKARAASPRRGVFHPSDSGDIIGHTGPTRETDHLFQKKSDLSRQLFPRDSGPILTKRPYELKLKDRMNLSPRRVAGRYAHSPQSRGNPLVYVEYGQKAPSDAYQDPSAEHGHPDDKRRKKVIERPPCSKEQKLLHHSKGRVTPQQKDGKSERPNLKHVGFEKNRKDSVDMLFKKEQWEEKARGLRTSYSQPDKLTSFMREEHSGQHTNGGSKTQSEVRSMVKTVLDNKFPSHSAAFKHLVAPEPTVPASGEVRNAVTLPALQKELASKANLHLSKKQLRKALFDKSDALQYKDFVKKIESHPLSGSDRAQSAPPARVPTSQTFRLGVPGRGANRSNFSRDIISFRY